MIMNTGSGAKVKVTAQFLPPIGKALEQYTWGEVGQVSEAGLGDDYWDVGDTHSVVLKGTFGDNVTLDTTLYSYILGFNHNQTYEGAGIHFGTWKTADGTNVCLVDSHYQSTASAVSSPVVVQLHD